MKVQAIRRHQNAYGDSYTKNPGKHYEHPSPEALIAAGLVEPADETRQPPTPKKAATKAKKSTRRARPRRTPPAPVAPAGSAATGGEA